LDTFTTILYPFIEGHNGYEMALSEHHWEELGIALKTIHNIDVPSALTSRIRRETYSPQAREAVKDFLERAKNDEFSDVGAKELTEFLTTKQAEILDLVRRAEQLAQILQGRPPEVTVCHSDIHAGNILLATDGVLYIVDWDEPILAPKERDLMYIGGGLLASGRTPQDEETLFYRAYGQTQTNGTALAYYRYERIIQDIAAYCEQLLLTDAGGEDRAQSLYYVKSNFLPDGTIDIAYQSDKTQMIYRR
jgi:spectinomycin phosphotransferase